MTKEQKLELFSKIKETGFFDELQQNEKSVEFANSIKNLKLLPSTDSRAQIKNAEDDFVKHFIMNDDWEVEHVYSSILKIFDDDNVYDTFLCSAVDSRFAGNLSHQDQLVDIINGYLHQEGRELYLYGYDNNGSPVYKIGTVDEEYAPKGIAACHIPIYIDKNPSGNSSYTNNHIKPDQLPAFVLAYNIGWDDYSVCTRFDLFYHDEDGNITHIGDVKILHKSYFTLEELRNKYYYVTHYMEDKYDVLPSDFCSLGQNDSYYHKINDLFGEQYRSVLWALKDCALFPVIEDKFSNHPYFFSLTREKTASDALDDILYELNGENMDERFFFDYYFKPEKAESAATIPFRFSSKGMFPNNLYAIIGRNGVGKSLLVSKLPLDLEASRRENFSHFPVFKKYISVSYCYYDNFTLPESTAVFNYRYCGLLKKMPNGENNILSREDLQSRLIKDTFEINKKNRISEWEEVMSTFFDQQTIQSWIKKTTKKEIIIDAKKVAEDAKEMSSGQSSFLYVFFNIMANIRTYSLILFDEPETHLHPEAITSLINAIHKMLAAYKSYGLIVTHSPIIIRELLSRNVLIMRREGNVPSVYKIGIEPFGENLSVLTNEVFGNEKIQPFFKNRIVELIGEGYSYDDIVSKIRTEKIPLSLNLKMFIKNLERARHEES